MKESNIGKIFMEVKNLDTQLNKKHKEYFDFLQDVYGIKLDNFQKVLLSKYLDKVQKGELKFYYQLK